MKSLALLLPLLLAVQAVAQDAPQTDDQKTFYSLGLLLGRNIAGFNLKPEELKFVVMGLQDEVQGKKAQVDVATYAPKIDELAKSREKVKADAEKKASKSFLDSQAKEKGAKVAKSGLIYTELKAGTGASPKASDTVKVHYHGTLRDGTVFDSSVQRAQPAEFPLDRVIPCWTEGVQKMKVGGKAKLVCPSAIAYGDRGAPPSIPGGAPLVFEVELLEIVKK